MSDSRHSNVAAGRSNSDSRSQIPDTLIFVNKRGILTAVINGITIHSPRNPRAEAEKIIQRLVEDRSPGLVIFGMGLAHHLRAIQNLFPEKHAICFEPNPQWMDRIQKHGISIDSLSAEGLRCTFFEASEDNWSESLLFLEQYLYKGYQLVALESYKRAYPNEYAQIHGIYRKFANRNSINRNTLGRFAERWIENILHNFLNPPDHASIRCLRSAFQGIPALLLAAGPTLSEIIPMIGELKKRMLLLAVDTSFPMCVKAGVYPDILVAVDPQYWNTKHFERRAGVFDRVLLVSETSAHPRSFRLLQRTAYFCASFFPLGIYFEQNVPDRDRIGAGGSVACSAWDILRYCGAGKIYTAGMDMGFPNRETHFRGSYFEETIAMSGNMLNPAENISFSYIISGDPVFRQCYSGGDMLSDRRMDMFCTWFEHQLKSESAIESYALSVHSRKIDGMRIADPSALLNLPVIRSDIDDRISRIIQIAEKSTNIPQSPTASHSLSPEQSKNLKELVLQHRAFAELYTSVYTTHTICSNALRTIMEYREGKVDKNSVLSALNTSDSVLLENSNRSVVGFLIPDTLETMNGQVQAGSLEEAIERSEHLYTQLMNSAGIHIRLFNKVRSKLPVGTSSELQILWSEYV